jgi:hypothetical protein
LSSTLELDEFVARLDEEPSREEELTTLLCDVREEELSILSCDIREEELVALREDELSTLFCLTLEEDEA